MIGQYSFGRLVVRGETYSRDVIIFADRIRANWWRAKGHEVCVADLDEVLAAQPEVVIIGTGANGLVRVLPKAREALAAMGAELIAEPTAEACETYNRLLGEGRNVVAALHLTC